MKIEELRKKYQEGRYKQSMAEELNAYLQTCDLKDNPVLMAFLGASWGLMAKYVLNPLLKLELLDRANQIFKKASETEPDNLEIRFLRFTIQSNAPGLLMRSLDITTDKKFIIEHLDTSDLEPVFKKGIIDYLIESRRCTLKELSILKVKLSEL